MFKLGWMCLLATACAPRLYSDPNEIVEPWEAPSNAWDAVTPPEALVGEGVSVGQRIVDIRGMDQHGDEVSIWQFWGQYVLVDLSTMWCGPCQDLAIGAEAFFQHYKDEGVMHLTVLHENEINEPCTLEELEAWSRFPSFHPDPDHPYDVITAPIVSDPGGISGSIRAIQDNRYPVALLVGPDMRVVARIDPATESRVEEVLEEALAAAK